MVMLRYNWKDFTKTDTPVAGLRERNGTPLDGFFGFAVG